MRVLVAEGDAEVRTILVGHLRQWGHEVIALSQGNEAWHMFRLDDYRTS
jgi:DNA-binding response OmpR family regulator